MLDDLHWLALTLGLTALFALPYVLNRGQVRGLTRAMGNPLPDDKPHAPWAERAIRAHANAVENLVVFAPAVLALQVTGQSDESTALWAAVYFFARLAHYVVYTLGIAYARTVAYLVGWVATIVLIVRLLGLV